MSSKSLLIDIDQCVRCYACEMACKQENELGVGPRWMQVFTIEPRRVSEGLHMDFVPIPCHHCDDPPCAHFCPTGAIQKRDDGMVIIERGLCNRCQLCIHGCPYGRISWDEEKGGVVKCDLCFGRISRGLEPSCVQHCFGGALQLVSEEELSMITRDQHHIRIGKVCYTSAKWKLKTVKDQANSPLSESS